MKEVARLADVSHATVSMVFSGKKRFSEKTRNRVLAAARKIQFVPDMGASNLRKGQSRIIGFVVNDIANPVYGRMAQMAESLATERGFQMIIADHQWSPARELQAIRRMIGFRAQGILWCGTERSGEAQELLMAEGAPAVVALDSCPVGFRGGFIGYDVRHSGRIAAQYLLQSGARNPRLFTVGGHSPMLHNFTELHQGFLEVLAKNGLPHGDSLVFSGLTLEEGRMAFHRMRSASGPPVDGILAINDLCAYGILEAADDLGIRVGRDLALLGIGNHPFSSLSRISLTSISQSPDKLVQAAMGELFDCFATKRQSTLRLSMKGEIIARNSCRPNGLIRTRKP